MTPVEKPRAASTEDADEVLGNTPSPIQRQAAWIADLLRDGSEVVSLPYVQENLSSMETLRGKLIPLIKRELDDQVHSSIRPLREKSENYSNLRDGFIAFSKQKLSRKRTK